MSKLTLKDISEKMRDIDICMMTTTRDDGELVARPMSNNREVDYDGDSYFFAYGKSDVAREIQSNPKLNLSLVHEPAIAGKSFYLSVMGQGRVTNDRAEMQKHWVKDLEIWFENGLDTPDLVMLNVKAKTLKYWHGRDEGEVSL